MDNKYQLTTEENVFVAKRNLVDYIWKSANLEGVAVTFPETEAIYNGLNVQRLRLNEILAINNLKRAWNFIISNVGYPIDFGFIAEINRIVGGDDLIYRAGQLRKMAVRISGKTWKPEEMLEDDIVRSEIIEILESGTSTDKAINLMLYIMRKQLFVDGNKRTAMLAANKIMIAEGAGVISVTLEDQPKFRELLVSFYETGNELEIKRFVYDHCIDGMVF